jgi:hypothetical protein
MLSSRSWKGEVRCKAFHQIKERFPLLRPKLYLPLPGAASYRYSVKQLLTSVVRENRTLRSVEAGGRVTAPGHPVEERRLSPYPD